MGIVAPTKMPQPVAPALRCRTLIITLPVLRFGTTMPSNSPQ